MARVCWLVGSTLSQQTKYTATGSPRFDGADSITFTGSNASADGDRTGALVLPSSLAFHERTRCGTSPRSFANRSLDWPLLRGKIVRRSVTFCPLAGHATHVCRSYWTS